MKKIKFIIPIAFVFIANYQISGQSTNLSHLGISSTTDWLGWNSATTIPIAIRHDNNTITSRVEFWTGGQVNMWVDPNKNVGIGNNILVGPAIAQPPFKLTVENDIDLECSLATPQVSGYRINGNIVLATPGVGQSNTHVGVGAGSVSTGSDNTFVGVSSGQVNTGGNQNSFLGSSSGSQNTTGSVNSYYGFESGNSNTTGNNNTFMGWGSGNNNNSGIENTFIGSQSGNNNSTAKDNTDVFIKIIS